MGEVHSSEKGSVGQLINCAMFFNFLYLFIIPIQTSAALALYIIVIVVSSLHTDGLHLQCTVHLDYLYLGALFILLRDPF